MEMQKIFKQGYRWQVGNGTSIGIWTNNTFELSRASDLIVGEANFSPT